MASLDRERAGFGEPLGRLPTGQPIRRDVTHGDEQCTQAATDLRQLLRHALLGALGMSDERKGETDSHTEKGGDDPRHDDVIGEGLAQEVDEERRDGDLQRTLGAKAQKAADDEGDDDEYADGPDVQTPPLVESEGHEKCGGSSTHE